MLNPVSTEALLYSATYVDNYIDSVENLPDDVQRHLSRIRDIDVQYRSLLRDVDHYYDLWRSLQNNNASDGNCTRRARAIARMQQSLIQAQELGDEKMQIVNLLQELIDHKTRQLDTDQKNLDIKEEMQQQQCRVEQLQQVEDIGPTPAKQIRTSSPIRDVNTYCVNGGSSGGAGGGGSTPNSERSGHASNGTTGSGTANGIGNIATTTVITVDNQRSASKRSRRRNESSAANNSSMELGGNESNSANEGGGGSNGGICGNERQSVQKSSSSGATQKKHSAQHQVAGSGGSSGAGGVNTSSTGATGSGNNSGKKKKRKTRGGQSSAQTSVREETPPPDPIDPDEPTYCVCNQISFGEMILCDNDLCPIEWFHFSCVSLVLKPKGKWFCPNCRGDRPNVMKPKAQFLKELERYNKEKEEKT